MLGAWLSTVDMHAKLAPSKLSELLHDSDLILDALVMRARLTDLGFGGNAELRIKKVYKGEYKEAMITIHWSHGKHDQRIRTIGETRLLFLKRLDDGTYTGTQYGRSYWPVKSDSEDRRAFTPYIYPTDLIKIDLPGLLKSANVISDMKDGKVEKSQVEALFIEDVLGIVAGKE